MLLSTLLLLLLSTSFTSAAYGDNCPSITCGTIPIRYPFYRVSTSFIPQSFCGYPGLALTCADNNSTQPILTLLENYTYIVKHIDYESNSVTLIDTDVVSKNSQFDCPRVRHNLTIDNYPLANRNLNLTFYFNCTFFDASIPAIDCLLKETEDEVRRSYVFEAGREPAGVGVCEEIVVAAVAKKVDSRYLVEGYGEAMRLGFVLDWRAEGVECVKCEKSGGMCGYEVARESFVCYCEDGGIAALKCKHGWDLKKKLIIAFSVCGGTALIMCAIFFIYQRRKKTNLAPSSYFTRNISSDLSSINDPEKMGALYGVKFFTYDELEEATDSFNDKREIGDGGFGTVYLGKLKDGRTVAVKRLYENNYKRVEQFLNEVEILTRLRHKNLVMLYGCTSRHSRELLLVYEYVSNGTIADHVHGRNAKPGSLPWETRLKIAVETASALKYLHATDIIHRDVKTNNILLDDNFSVKVADFGLSRLFPLDVTHVSTAPQGTPGYVDPEYHQCYQLTDKSDVYSFGVVLVELISSKPAVDITRHRHEINLSNMAINKIHNGTLQELVDPSIGFDKDCNVRKSVTAVAELAFQCLQSDKDMRPTMQEVLEILTRIQCCYSQIEDKAEELDVFSDEFVLLKSGPLPLSPDSVTVKWVSGSAASNSSG